MQTRPKRGQGERFLECRYYEDCLDLAAIQNWRSFNCEACDLYKTIFGEREHGMDKEAEKPENTRICKECEIRPTIQPSSPYCAICLGLKAKESRARKKRGHEDAPRTMKGKQGGQVALQSEKGPTQTIGQPEIIDSKRNVELVLKLGKHGYLLKEIERLAEEEVRSTEEQVIYILKNYLSTTQKPASH